MGTIFSRWTWILPSGRIFRRSATALTTSLSAESIAKFRCGLCRPSTSRIFSRNPERLESASIARCAVLRPEARAFAARSSRVGSRAPGWREHDCHDDAADSGVEREQRAGELHIGIRFAFRHSALGYRDPTSLLRAGTFARWRTRA